MAEAGLQFKGPRQKREWLSDNVNGRLRLVIEDARVFCARLGWDPLVITCVWRSAKEEKELSSSGVHHAWRAVDIRTRDVDIRLVEDLERYLESRWSYDPTRPKKVLCYSALHGTGPHLHIQVTDRTVLRGMS